MITDAIMQSILDRAMEEEIGIRLDSSDNNQLRNRLYTFRKDKPQYAELMFFIPVDKMLYIVKKSTEMPDA